MTRPSILSLTAFTFSLIAIILTCYATISPNWTKDDPSEKVNKNEEIVEGLWVKCTIKRNRRSCEYYDEFILDSAWELISSRVLCVLSLIVSTVAFGFSLLGQDCVLD